MPNGNNYDDYPVSSNLDQIGDTGFYLSPNEPVDPSNCALFPNSPYCGGNGLELGDRFEFNPISPITSPLTELAEDAIEAGKRKLADFANRQLGRDFFQAPEETVDEQSDFYSENEFERCVYINPGLVFGINSLPPIIICKRKNSPGNSSSSENKDDPDEEDEILIEDRIYPNGCVLYGSFYNKFQDLTPDGLFLGSYLAIGLLGVSSTDVAFPPCRLKVIAKDAGFLDGAVTDGGNLRRLPGRLKALHYYAYDENDNLIKFQNTDAYVSHKMRITIAGKYEDPNPTPPNDPDNGDKMCQCSNEIDDLKKMIKKLLSLIEFEAKVPVLLTDPDAKETTIKTIPNFIAWQSQQLDGLFGQFPIEIEIKDADPNQKGDQKQTVKIPNLAEAIADLYGLQFQNNFWQQIELQTAICQAAELIAIRNQTLQTLKSLDATNDYLGIDFDTEEIKVNSAFDPKSQIDGIDDSSDQWTAFLQPSEYKLQVEKYKGKDTLVGAIKNLLFAAGIIKARFWQVAAKNGSRLIDDLKDFSNRNNEEVDQWAKDLEDPKHPQNKDFPVPKVMVKRKAKNGTKA